MQIESIRLILHSPVGKWENDPIKKCRVCSQDIWEVHHKTGTGNLPSDKIKLKCKNCGLFFVTNTRFVEKLLGE